jgi:EAL domain-containing protein (putative c-di-GMP-specific phosphodiesterase class I)
VATREQFDFLGARGCHCFQGFWISEALPADKFVEFSRKH